MNEQIRETLSALIDGELTPTEISVAVEQLTESDELRRDWSHYHLIGDAMRGEPVRREYQRIVEDVRDRLQGEAVVLAPPRHFVRWSKSQWAKPVAGSALAASVAVAAVLVAPHFINQQPSAGQERVADRTQDPASYAIQSGTRWNPGKPDVESRLNSYLVNHQEYAPSGRMKGILPYATFVAYDRGR